MCFFARQSAQQGNPNAKSALEEIRNNSEIYHLRGGNNFAEKAKENEDLQQAQKLCLLGMTLAQAYHNGEKGEDDHKQAIEWIKQAAEMGYAEAQFCISKCYASGEVVEKDMQKSIEMLTKAAEQGHDEAQYFLGLFYNAGNGSQKSTRKNLPSQPSQPHLQQITRLADKPSLTTIRIQNLKKASSEVSSQLSRIYSDNLLQTCSPTSSRQHVFHSKKSKAKGCVIFNFFVLLYHRIKLHQRKNDKIAASRLHIMIQKKTFNLNWRSI